MGIKKWLDYVIPPIFIGLLAGIVALWGNSLSDNGSTNNTNNHNHSNNWKGPVSYSNAVQLAAPSVVSIYTLKPQIQARHPLMDDPLFRHIFNRADIPTQQKFQRTLGSGVIMSKDGYLLTNFHVINGASEIAVQLSDGNTSGAEIIGVDREDDLAVLKIPYDNLRPIPIGDSDQLQVGDVVLAIGNPLSIGQTVTQGIVSAVGRFGVFSEQEERYEDFIQTDAAINKGNSGGALTDAYGNLVGINTAIIDDNTGYYVGIGFAIPSNTAVQVLQDILKYGRVVRGWLGIEGQKLTSYQAKLLNIDQNGLLVTAIFKNGPADKGGLLPGDIITHVNGKPVGDGRRSIVHVARSRPGDEMSLRVLRDNEYLVLSTVVGIKPIQG